MTKSLRIFSYKKKTFLQLCMTLHPDISSSNAGDWWVGVWGGGGAVGCKAIKYKALDLGGFKYTGIRFMSG
jgi:hypothetical protein